MWWANRRSASGIRDRQPAKHPSYCASSRKTSQLMNQRTKQRMRSLLRRPSCLSHDWSESERARGCESMFLSERNDLRQNVLRKTRRKERIDCCAQICYQNWTPFLWKWERRGHQFIYLYRARSAFIWVAPCFHLQILLDRLFCYWCFLWRD